VSLLTATQITAIATAVLAFFAVVTAVFAYLAFRGQSAQVTTLQQQAKDQAKMLEVQSTQLHEQQKLNVKQTEVLELQVQELQETLAERKREAEGQRRVQASKVFLWEEHLDREPGWQGWKDGEPVVFAVAHVVNSSDQPVYDVELRWRRGASSWGEPNPQPLPTVMPGKEVTRGRKFPPDTNMAVSGAALWFRDAAGVAWLRRRDGELMEWES
jgi:hypothetical protein